MALGVVSLSVSNTVLLLPPAAPEPDRLVAISSRSASEAVGQISYPDYKYIRENNHVFTDVAAAPNSISVNAKLGREPRGEGGHQAGFRHYSPWLGIRPYLGRFFSPATTKPRNLSP